MNSSSRLNQAPGPSTGISYDIESEVLQRYQEGARQQQPNLCCPTEYASTYLELIPQEIIDKDYGCGDPTQYVNAGETVIDLGAGAGKNCYIVAQKLGSEGQAIGVDFNDEMLTLARKYQDEFSNRLGYRNTSFLKGKIQDLALPLDLVQAWLQEHPISSLDDLMAYEQECNRLRQSAPLIADASVDVVISNCVLNLVRPDDKRQLFQEIHRVLKPGGRAVISDIVCDEPPTQAILSDPGLWSGCIAGAFLEAGFLAMFEDAGFYGVEILNREETPWQTIDGIEFRSMTVRAYKGNNGDRRDRKQAVLYRGPWKQVTDDDGRTYTRGEKIAVCDRTYQAMTSPNSPYEAHIIGLEPRVPVPPEEAKEFSCCSPSIRSPRELKGATYRQTQSNPPRCC
ncbi:MAG: methyltransferase domain-containing protein [Cyanobacteria bacterium J06642_12]